MRIIAKERGGECLSKIYVDSHTKLLWRCKDNHVWWAKPYLIKNSNCWCPLCKESKGEKLISDFLDNNKILYFREHKFDECRGVKQKLPFDFYLPDFNVLIEFDGKQHYEPTNFYGCSDKHALTIFNKLKRNDEIKTNFCLEKKIKLIRIGYDKKIIEILEKSILNNG